MRTLGKVALTSVGMLALAIAPSWGQAQAPPPRPGGVGDPGGLGGGPILLMVPNVQEELKLTHEQTQTLPQTILQIVIKAREQAKGLRDLPIADRVNQQRILTRSMNEDAKKALALTPDQARRFDQIGLQQRGIEAFSEPEIQARVMLTDEQKGKIRGIGENAHDRLQAIAQGAGDDRAEMARKIRQLQKELMTEALAELSDDQKAAWKELTGEPFEVRFERPRPK
jgi:hypothetical protein